MSALPIPEGLGLQRRLGADRSGENGSEWRVSRGALDRVPSLFTSHRTGEVTQLEVDQQDPVYGMKQEAYVRCLDGAWTFDGAWLLEETLSLQKSSFCGTF